MSNTQNQPQVWLQDGFYKTWKTKQDVVAALRQAQWLFESFITGRFLSADRQYLAYGESDPPSYVPCHYKDGWGVKEITYFHPRVKCLRKPGRRVMWVRAIDPDLPPVINILLEEEVIHLAGTHIKHFSKK